MTLYDRTNLAAMTWTNLHFTFTAKSASTTLTFGFRNDPGYFGFDDVSLLPVAAPALRSLVKANTTVQFTTTTTVNAVYQLQYTTSLINPNWANLGAPFTATNTTMPVTDPNATDVQRFYRLVVVP